MLGVIEMEEAVGAFAPAPAQAHTFTVGQSPAPAACVRAPAMLRSVCAEEEEGARACTSEVSCAVSFAEVPSGRRDTVRTTGGESRPSGGRGTRETAGRGIRDDLASV